MGSLFSKRVKNPQQNAMEKLPNPQRKIMEKDRAILNLKLARDKLRRYRSKMETDMKKLEVQARELIALKLKNRALLVLKLKRFKEKEVDGIDAKLMTVQSQISDLEWASINLTIISAIESGTRELNRIHEERTLEDVQMLMDETNDAIEVENRINLVLAGQLTGEDEEELESELEALMTSISAPSPTVEDVSDLAAEIDKKIVPAADRKVEEKLIALPVAPDAPILPKIPNHEVKMKKVLA